MSRRASIRAVVGAALTCLAGAMSVLTGGPAQASAVPFTDPAAHGYIGLCNASGQQITSGSLADKPFVVRAVSSAPAPAGYTVRQGAKATLFAYQPIDGIDPGDWSGEALTGSAFFSNPSHPMAAGTVLDNSMGDFVSAYPAHWDRLVQLRIFYGQPDKSTYTTSYPAAVLQVDGSSWHVVQGGPVDCRAGKTMPSEQLALPPSRFASASASIAASRSAAAARGGHAGPSGPGTARAPSAGSPSDGTSSGDAHSTTSAAAPSGSVPDGASTSATAAAAANSSSGGSSGGSSWPVVVAVIAAVALAAGGAYWFRRRTSVA
jgi:hypothetical protein